MSTPIVTLNPATNLFLEAAKKFQSYQAAKPKNYPLILIVGDTGSGKTRSMMNLPPNETAIINCENKPLSFPNSQRFPYHFTNFNLPSDVDICLDRCLKEPTIKYIPFDSFARYLDMLQQFATDAKANDKNSYARWNYFNELVFAFLTKIKNCGDKIIILTGFPEIVEIPKLNYRGDMISQDLVKQRRFKIAGKRWEGVVEGEFTIVFHTDVSFKDGKSQYTFITNSDGTMSAKSPEGMFPMKIPNDMFDVCKKVKEFYNLGE